MAQAGADQEHAHGRAWARSVSTACVSAGVRLQIAPPRLGLRTGDRRKKSACGMTAMHSEGGGMEMAPK